MTVRQLRDPAEKARTAEAILNALPDWFGLPGSTRHYIEESRELPFWVCEEAGERMGFLALKETSPATAEIFVMGILPQHHRRGAGSALFDAALTYARAQGCRYMQVKTVESGHYDEYDRTNAFYQALGFEPLEVFPTLWDPWNPCQVYVKYIG